jgi:hypothetical protein|nr:MAG TPA: hypothetical protein [Bacteriophage sp.]
MKINLSSIVSKLSSGESAIVVEKFISEDMESIYRFLLDNKDLTPNELKGYYKKHPSEFNLFEFIKSYFSVYKESGSISVKRGNEKKNSLIILS